MHYCNPQVGHARVPRKESPAGGEGTGETEELTGRADRKSLHGICAPNDDLGLDRKTLDFRGYAAAASVSSQASRMAWISSHVGWSRRDGLNRAAIKTRRSLAAMSAVD